MNCAIDDVKMSSARKILFRRAIGAEADMQNIERVILVAEAVSGDHDNAVEWLSQPLDTFGGQTPMQLLAEGCTDKVIDYLHSIAPGFVG